MGLGRYKKRKLIYRGVDYIKAFIIEPENEHFLKKMSANSNDYYIIFAGEKLTVTKVNITGKYRYFYQILHNNTSIGFVGLSPQNGKPFIEITGQGLTIFGVNIYYFLMKKLKLDFEKYKRFDICFDLELDINYFWDRILDSKYKEKNKNGEYEHSILPFITKKNGLETIYFGKKNIKQNSYILNRIYNKLLDSKNKDKLFLYEDKYKNEDGTFKNITRFESEIREDLAKFYKFEALKDNKLLYFRLVKSFYKYNVQYFKYLKDKDFLSFQKEYKLKNKISIKNIKNGVLKEPTSAYQERLLKIKNAQDNQIKYGKTFITQEEEEQALKMFISYGKKLFKNGYDIKKLNEILENNLNIKP